MGRALGEQCESTGQHCSGTGGTGRAPRHRQSTGSTGLAVGALGEPPAALGGRWAAWLQCQDSGSRNHPRGSASQGGGLRGWGPAVAGAHAPVGSCRLARCLVHLALLSLVCTRSPPTRTRSSPTRTPSSPTRTPSSLPGLHAHSPAVPGHPNSRSYGIPRAHRAPQDYEQQPLPSCWAAGTPAAMSPVLPGSQGPHASRGCPPPHSHPALPLSTARSSRSA